MKHVALRTQSSITSTEQYYFYEEALGVSSNINPAGGEDISLGIAFFLLLSWLVVFACVVNGVQSTGRVVHFTATAPYLIMIGLIIAGACNMRSREAFKAFFKPDVRFLLSKRIETQYNDTPPYALL